MKLPLFSSLDSHGKQLVCPERHFTLLPCSTNVWIRNITFDLFKFFFALESNSIFELKVSLKSRQIKRAIDLKCSLMTRKYVLLFLAHHIFHQFPVIWIFYWRRKSHFFYVDSVHCKVSASNFFIAVEQTNKK